MAVTSEASRGSIAGASGDAGTEYRRGVAGYVAACALAGVRLPITAIPPAFRNVQAIAVETDDPVDDIRVDFESGWRAFIQAKRSLDAGKPLKEAVAQWVKAVKIGLDPGTDRLVIVAGHLSGTMRALREVLERGRTELPGSPTKDETRGLAAVDRWLVDLNPEQRATILKCAVIWELDVEEPERTDSQVAMGHLCRVVADGSHESAAMAWGKLTTIAGRIARLRGGHTLAGWQDALHGEGVVIGATGSSPAAVLERRRQVLVRYAERIEREASEIDLRALGAELPPVRMDDADARVEVGIDPRDERKHRPLLWAFLRRGRVVLTGLPGGGKSTALKQLAAQLVADPTLPLPVRVSLRDIRTGRSHPGFREQLVKLAVRDSAHEDQVILAEEIHARLDRDEPIALLLDSLDETYDRRATVVSGISNLVGGLPTGVCVLLATRDVAYGKAATLGWPTVRLRPPADIKRTVSAILTSAADYTVTDETARTGWVEERETWVDAALAHDGVLKETPLMPVLLSLLSVKRSVDQLPARRAEILRAVVYDFLAGRELHPEKDRALGTLDGRATTQAALMAFATEASTILGGQGQATEDQVVTAVAADLREPWGLPPAWARQAALDAIHIFDEAGIFVLSSEGGPVVARIALLAEVGDAMHVVEHPDLLPDWVEKRVASEQFEPLILACVLTPAVVEHAVAELGQDRTRFGLAMALARAAVEGANLDDDDLHLVCQGLIDHVADGTHEGWLAWRRLIDLPIPSDLQEDAVSAAGQHSPEHALVAQVSLVHRADLSFSETDVGLLKDVLALRRLSRSPSSIAPTGAFDWINDLVDHTLNEAQLAAATKLLDNVPGAASLVADRAKDAPGGLSRSLVELLWSRGYDDEAEDVRLAEAQAASIGRSRLSSILTYQSETNYEYPLEIIAGHPKGALTTRQEILLDELADFLETLDLNSAGSAQFVRSKDGVIDGVVALTVGLYGFDRQVLAAEAAIAVARIQRWGTDPFWALFDQAEHRSNADWSRVADPVTAVKLLTRLLTFGLGQAIVAVRSLFGAPVADIAAPMLRDLLPDLASSPSHERLGALALGSLDGGPEPQCWATSDDPVLREVAAQMMDPLDESYQQFLDDPDGHVREAAIEEISASQLPDRVALLEHALKQPAPGWMCRSCRTVNRAGATACSKDGCFRSAANPTRAAKEALAELSGA